MLERGRFAAAFLTFAALLACANHSPELPSAASVTVALEETSPPPAPERPLGTNCTPDFSPDSDPKGLSGGNVGFRTEPFCVAWTDIFLDETGFRIVIGYGGREFVYQAPANTNDLFPPAEAWPRANGKGDVDVSVYAITPTSERLVDGIAVIVN